MSSPHALSPAKPLSPHPQKTLAAAQRPRTLAERGREKGGARGSGRAAVADAEDARCGHRSAENRRKPRPAQPRAQLRAQQHERGEHAPKS